MPTTHYQPSYFRQFSKQLIIAESTRMGGVSQAPYTSLNLGLHTPDNANSVVENRRRFCANLNFSSTQLAGGFQVHDNKVLIIQQAGQSEGYDAFITNKRGIILSITVADCCPVLIYDPVRKAIGAAHAGWKGTVGQIAKQTLLLMESTYNTVSTDCWAYIGTCIGANDFEVDADVADHFETDFKWWEPKTKKFHVDLKAANGDQLKKAGIPNEQIEYSPYSTVADNNRYFSHRAEKGKTGRMLAVIGMR